MASSITEAPTRIPLWTGPAPFSHGDEAVDRPFLDVYLPAPEVAVGAAMLLFPGGSYTFLSDRSGVEYARWLTAHGVAGIVVNFRLGSNGYRYPALLADARQACAVARQAAGQWGVDRDRIGVIGTSAGGHLAAMLLTGAAFDDPEEAAALRPACGVLCYPVISMLDPIAHAETRGNFLGTAAGNRTLQERFSGQLRVTADTPACFVWHTLPDPEVPATHSQLFAAALQEHGVPYELHLYGQGAHALGLARAVGLQWPEDCIRWLRTTSVLAEVAG